MRHIILIQFMVICSFLNLPGLKGQEIFILDKNVWEEYARGVDDASIWEWIKRRKINYRIIEEKWKLPNGFRYWIYFRNRGLRVWFPSEAQNLDKDYNSFKSLLLHQPRIKKIQKQVRIRKVVFQVNTVLIARDIMTEIKIHADKGDKQWKVAKVNVLQDIKQLLLENDKHKYYSNKQISDVDKYAMLNKQYQKLNELSVDFGPESDRVSTIESKVRKYKKNSGKKKGNKHQSDSTITPGKNRGNQYNSKNQGEEYSQSKKGSNDGTSSGGSSSGILNIPLPMKTDFSNWIQVLLMDIMGYLQIKDLTVEALLLAYSLVPELIEGCGKFLNDLNELTRIDELDRLLNKAANFYQDIERFLPYVKDAHSLLTSGEFIELLNKVDFEKINLNYIKRSADNVLPKDVLDKFKNIEKFIPMGSASFAGVQSFNVSQFREILTNGVEQVVLQQMDKQLNQIGIDIREIIDCNKRGDCEELLESQTIALIQKHSPQEVGTVATEFLKSGIEGAAIKSIERKIDNFLPDGVNVKSFYENLKGGDFKNALLDIGINNLHHLEEYAPIKAAIIQGREASPQDLKNVLKAYFEDIGDNDFGKFLNDGIEALEWVSQNELKQQVNSSLRNLIEDPGQIEDFIRNRDLTLINAIIQRTGEELGFENINIQDLIKRDIVDAVELILKEKGKGNNYKKKTLELKKIIANRVVITSILLDLFEDMNQYSQKEIEQRLLDYRVKSS